MNKSTRTKKCRTLQAIFTALHLICMIGPFMYFIPYALAVGEPVEKITLSMFTIIGGSIALLALLMDVKHRQGLHKTIFWLLIIGITICLKKVETFVYILAVISILDELIFYKLKNRYSELYRTNKEIDRRG